MRTEQTEIAWTWDGETVRVGVEPTVLLLPALSSISTRGEMRPLAERRAPEFTTVAADWPGFGDRTGGPFHRPTTVRQLGPRRA
jgi:pimeloyl-ACP methyl ester carboxylesterase